MATCILTIVALLQFAGSTQRAAAPSPDPKTSPVFLAVLRKDGLLVPAAIYDGRDWWNRWPFSYGGDETVTKLPVPGSIDEIPDDWLPPGIRLPRRWNVQLVSGGDRQIQLGRPERPAIDFAMSLIGIRTPYHSRELELTHVGEDDEAGIAVSGPARLGRFVAVTEREGASLLHEIRSALNDAETRAIAERIDLEWKGRTYTFPATPAERASHPFQGICWIGETASAGRSRDYYFTASKDYGAKPYPDCDATVDFSALVVRDRDGRVTARAEAMTTFDCTRDNAISVSFEPLASVRLSDRLLWFVKINVEDGYDYRLVDPSFSGDAGSIDLKGLWQLRSNSRQIENPFQRRGRAADGQVADIEVPHARR